MSGLFTKPPVLGAVVGALLGISIILLARLAEMAGSIGAAQPVINFLAALPSWLMITVFDLPDSILAVAFLIYWTLVGLLFGRLFGSGQKMGTVSALLLAVALIVGHIYAQVEITRDLDSALKTLADWMSDNFIK